MKRKKSTKITRELADYIRFLVLQVGLFQHQAAALVGVNQGRVSEVINGKLFPPDDSEQSSFGF